MTAQSKLALVSEPAPSSRPAVLINAGSSTACQVLNSCLRYSDGDISYLLFLFVKESLDEIWSIRRPIPPAC